MVSSVLRQISLPLILALVGAAYGSPPRHPPGARYEATVPDTLDLAHRAELAINGITGVIEPKDFEMYGWIFFQGKPAYMTRHMNSRSVLMSKCLEALPMLRIMSGSAQNLDLEAGSLKLILESISPDDGLFWSPATPENYAWHTRTLPPTINPKTKPIPEAHVDYACIYGQFRTPRTLMAWYQYTGDPLYKEKFDLMVEGIEKFCLRKGDYAYFPGSGDTEIYLGATYSRKGWPHQREPKNEQDGAEEGSVFMSYGTAPGVLSLWGYMTGNKKSLALAGEFKRFLTKKKMWGTPPDVKDGNRIPNGMTHDPDLFGKRSAELGHWEGHPPGHATTIRALLDYAIVTNDPVLKQFVRGAYDWARNLIDVPMGRYPGCNCTGPRMIAVAIKLTEAGIGDYWEDVDRAIRNYPIEQQITDAAALEETVIGRPDYKITDSNYETNEDVIKRSVGLFLTAPTFSHLCCIPHGSMGLYYAWDAAVRHADGQVRVNLLLNRASPWLDVDSYLPYEGKVVIHNKTARGISVRIPLWVETQEVTCQVDTSRTKPVWFGRYLMFNGLAEDSKITITFPVKERTETFGAYTARFKGNTIIDINPEVNPGGYPIFRRDHYKARRAPMKKKTRYVSERRIEVW